MGKTDLPPLSDEEEAHIQAGISADPDNPEWTAEEMRSARPFAEVCPELAASARRMRGPQRTPTKKLVSLRLSQDVIDRLREGGPGWQTRADEMLRKAVGL